MTTSSISISATTAIAPARSSTLRYFFRGGGIEVVLDHHPAAGEQQFDTLRVGLEQLGQVGLDHLGTGAGDQLAGKGDFKAAHWHLSE